MQPILVLAFFTVNLLSPTDFLWFVFQLMLQEISFKTFFFRLWNDFVSIISAFYLVFKENALFNVLILLPVDIIWYVLQFIWWVIEVITIQWWFLWEGFLLLLRELYVGAYWIIMDNASFQNMVSENLGVYFFFFFTWPIWLVWYFIIYFFAG